MNSELSLQEEINIYISSNLTPSELFIIRMLFIAQEGEPKHLINYLSNTADGKELYLAVLQNLLNKKVITKESKIPVAGDSLRPDDIIFNKNFIKRWVRESNQLGKELWELFPPFLNIGGKLAPLKGITKAGFYSMDAFCLYYAKQIKLAGTTHERVLEALQYGIDNNVINYTILEFIASRKWLEIEYLRDSGNIAGYDNTELI